MKLITFFLALLLQTNVVAGLNQVQFQITNVLNNYGTSQFFLLFSRSNIALR